MAHDHWFDERWERYTNIEFLKREREEEDGYCGYARKFSEWVETLPSLVAHKPDILAINQDKVQLLDKYFEWRSYVPKSHRNRTGSKAGHTCIYHVFSETYNTLKVAELSLTPPLLFLPEPPPPPPPSPQIAGIFLGELDEE
jgi:hypothetical protein